MRVAVSGPSLSVSPERDQGPDAIAVAVDVRPQGQAPRAPVRPAFGELQGRLRTRGEDLARMPVRDRDD